METCNTIRELHAGKVLVIRFLTLPSSSYTSLHMDTRGPPFFPCILSQINLSGWTGGVRGQNTKVDRLQMAAQELQESLNLPLRKYNAELHIK